MCAVELIVNYITLLLNAIKFKLVSILSGLTWFFMFKFTVFRTTSKWKKKEEKNEKKKARKNIYFLLISLLLLFGDYERWAAGCMPFMNIVFVIDCSELLFIVRSMSHTMKPKLDENIHLLIHNNDTRKNLWKRNAHVHHIFIVHSFNSARTKIPAEKKTLKNITMPNIGFKLWWCSELKLWNWETLKWLMWLISRNFKT